MNRPKFADRLLAEAVRAYERDGAEAVDDPQAEQAGRAAGGDTEQRIIIRAGALPVADGLRNALHHLNTVVGWIIVIGALLAFLAGVVTARATLGVNGTGGVVNFYWVLGGVLGVQTIALALWFIVFGLTLRSRSPRDRRTEPAAVVSLGSIALGIAQWLSRKLNRTAEQAAAVEAAGRVHATGSLGRWTFSSITHGLWLAFNIGCLGMIILLLSARHYTFVWETTILTERHYVQLTRLIAWLPEQAGFAGPTEEQIAASQRRDGAPLPENAREAWSSLLVGSVIVYGFAPRLLLLGLSLGLRRRAKQRFALDTTLPGYARLERRLADVPPHLHGAADEGEDGVDAAAGLAESSPPAEPRPTGPPAIVGVEINQPQTAWPPTVSGVRWDDLGLVENRDDQRRIIDQLTHAATEPSALMIVCDLTTTPDRGIARLIRRLHQPLTRPAAMVLTGGQSLRKRGYSAEHIAQRVEDWRQLAQDAGVPDERIIEADLDHLTDTNAARIATLASPDGEAGVAEPSKRGIEQAMQHIVEHVGRWQQRGEREVNTAEQAELHRDIAQVYRSDAPQWRNMFAAPSELTGNVAERVRSSADRVVNLLPQRLLRSPRWLAAGAMSGALGCIAAATLLSPVAIAALPSWSVIGAAIAAAVQPAGTDNDARDKPPGADFTEAIRAAALFAMLLELQGRDEATITRILDRAIVDDDSLVIHDAAAAKAALDDLRHRFDLALAEAAT